MWGDTTDGWIKLHRCLLNKAIWKLNDAQRIVFITVLLLANHKGNQWLWKGEKFTAEAGQFVTSIGNLAKLSRVSRQSARTALDNMSKLDFLTYESTKTGILVTVTNWGLYQSTETDSTNTLTINQPTVNQQSTTNKNDKNDKNEKDKPSSSRTQLMDVHFKLSRWLRTQILSWKPDASIPENTDSALKGWANEMRLMMERNKRTEERIVDVIDYLVTDEFWRVNVMSATKLRKQFDVLEAKMRTKEAQMRK